MESKEALPLPHHNHPTSPPPSTTNLRRFLRYTASALILYTTFIIIGLLNPSSSIPFFSSCAKWNSAVAPPHRKVALEAHIMSKCPDAQDCLRDLILPTMQQVSDQVDFTLSYIGQYVVSPSQPPSKLTPSESPPPLALNANTAPANVSATSSSYAPPPSIPTPSYISASQCV